MARLADVFYRARNYLLLLLFLLIAYLPLSSFRFALKNDAYLYNFPNKFFFSEAIHHGVLPTWNPYLNFGFPLYADPGFAWWHPITWIFGLIGYNAYTFTIEVLLYIFIGGCGMYRLCRSLNFRQDTAFACSAMFMCSGFFVGNLQHINFLTCAAFLPWLLAYWLRLQQHNSWRDVIAVGVAGYLLCTGGHPSIPIGALYFMGVFALAYYFTHRRTVKLKVYALQHLTIVLLLLMLLIPMLWSIFKILPYYSRGHRIDQTAQIHLGFTLPAFLSFFTPLPTARGGEMFGTDLSMRNAYYSLPGFIFFLSVLLRSNKTAIQKTFLVAAVAGLLLALGGPLKATVFGHLPLLNYIRSNGEFRVFAIVPLILLGGFGYEDFIANKQTTHLRVKQIATALLLIAIAFASYYTLQVLQHQPIFFPDSTAAVKRLLDGLEFPAFMLAGLLIIIVITSAMLFLQAKKGMPSYLLGLVLADLFINTIAMLPITGVGATTTHRMQQIFDYAPKGFVFPSLLQPSSFQPGKEELQLIGDWAWYNKQILKDSLINYPSQFRSNPLVPLPCGPVRQTGEGFYCVQQPGSRIDPVLFRPTRFSFRMFTASRDTLHIKQNFFPGWIAKVNGQHWPVTTKTGTELVIPLPAGKQEVEVYFSMLHSLVTR